MSLRRCVFAHEATVKVGRVATLRLGTKALDGNDFLIYNKATGALIYDANGDASGGSVVFAMLSVGLTLTHADFFIV